MIRVFYFRFLKMGIGWMAVLAVLMISSAGCEPLRKKFVRKKKQERVSEVVPVLEPVDYPREVHSRDSLYRHHYALWKVWFKDLVVAMAEQDSDKRILHILDQLILELQSLQTLVGDARSHRLNDLIDQIRKIEASYQRPAALRNHLILKNQAVAIDRRFRDEFAYQKVREFLVAEPSED